MLQLGIYSILLLGLVRKRKFHVQLTLHSYIESIWVYQRRIIISKFLESSGSMNSSNYSLSCTTITIIASLRSVYTSIEYQCVVNDDCMVNVSRSCLNTHSINAVRKLARSSYPYKSTLFCINRALLLGIFFQQFTVIHHQRQIQPSCQSALYMRSR